MSAPTSDHRQNAITWFTMATLGSVLSIVIGGVGAIAAIIIGVASLVFGAFEMKRHRQDQAAGRIKRKPKLKTRLKKAAKKQAKETWHGKTQGGKADYRRKHPKPPKPPKPETTPKGNCSVRCRRSPNSVETCECVCRGKRHGTEA